MNILLVATRDPRGRLTGRKLVLRTIVRSLERLGHSVTVAALGEPDGEEDRPFMAPVLTLGRPRPARVVWNVILSFPTGRFCLNECLYYSPTIRARLAELVRRKKYDLVVADMIRTAPYALNLGPPAVIDLDDLLSERYADLARNGRGGDRILGYYGESLPAALVRPLGALARRMLRVESRMVARREEEVARRAEAASLVGRNEGEGLALRTGKQVHWAPMAIDIPSVPACRVRERPASLVFLGTLGYQPNLDAVRWFVREVRPQLDRRELEGLALTVVGSCPEDVRRSFAERERIRFTGYVEDLGAELGRHQIFVAPIVSGSGLKTKILEAMAWGLPVVSTPFGVKGMGVRDREHCYLGESPDEFAAAIQRAVDDPDGAEETGLAARRWVARGFAPDVLARRWDEILADALASRRRSGALPARQRATGLCQRWSPTSLMIQIGLPPRS